MRTSTLVSGCSDSFSPIHFCDILSFSLYWAHFSTRKVRGGSPALPSAGDKYIKVGHRNPWRKKNVAELRHISAFYVGVTLDSTCSVLLLSWGVSEGSGCSALTGVQGAWLPDTESSRLWGLFVWTGGFPLHIMTRRELIRWGLYYRWPKCTHKAQAPAGTYINSSFA